MDAAVVFLSDCAGGLDTSSLLPSEGEGEEEEAGEEAAAATEEAVWRRWVASRVIRRRRRRRRCPLSIALDAQGSVRPLHEAMPEERRADA